MDDRDFMEFMKKLYFEAKTKGLKVRKAQNGEVIIYAGKRKIKIVTEVADA